MASTIFNAALYFVAVALLLTTFLPFSPMTIDIVNLSRKTQLKIFEQRKLLWAISGAAFALLIVFGAADGWLPVTLVTIAVFAMLFWSGYVPFVMTPPNDPEVLSMSEADEVLQPDDMVIGLSHNGETRAYARDTIARPHFYADTVGGQPVTMSYCILCNSGVAFKTELDGKPMNLSCVTAYDNNIIYLDENSGNYIQQLESKIIEGPDKGAELEFLPSIMTTWSEWKSLHPGTTLYHAPAATLRDKMVAMMLSLMIPIRKLAARSKPWHRVHKPLDTRLPAMSFVYGVELGGERTAYAQEFLAENPVYDDVVGGQPITVFYDSAREIAAIFSRDHDGKTLSFDVQSSDPLIARDAETKSSWDIAGRASDGPLAGQALTAVPHFNKVFWFSWALFKEGTEVRAG